MEDGEEKINLKSLREGGDRSQGHGTRQEFERRRRGNSVEKRVCEGDVMVAGGRGWAETARLM